MNVVNLDNPCQQKISLRGKKLRDKNVIWTRDKPIINVMPKYDLDALAAKRCNPQSKTESSVFKTPLPRIPRRTPGSSVRPKSSSSAPTDGGRSSGGDTIDSYVILALTSGRGDASCEIGMAAMDLQYPHLIVSQISDTQTFTSTMANINLFQPIEIVMPDTMCISDELKCNLFSTIRDKYQQIMISAISRQYFNKTEGLDRVKTHTSTEYSSIELVIKEKYYALAATAALFKYIEHIQHITHTPKSMKVEFQCSQNKMLIDVDSAQSLELVSCLISYPKNFNLFGALNRCQTRMGRCQLRASILQPSCDRGFIEQRQKSIAELLANRQLHTLIIPTLRRLGGIDKLVHGLCVKTLATGDDDNVKVAERKLNYILTLKNTLETVPELQKLLEKTNTAILKQIHKNLSDSRFQLMLDQILEVVHEEAQCVTGYTSLNMQRCFAIKAGKSDMLDFARQTYCELIDKMKEQVETYAKEYRMDLSLACNSLLGYHIQMPVPKRVNFDVSDLPSIFIHVEKKRNVIYMTTSWLLVMSLHCKDASEELHLMSAVLLDDLMESLRESIVCLYQLSADIAELDQITSLARISAIPEFTEPIFGEKFKVENSRHPIRYILGNEDIVPNDIDVSTAYNFALITGPNMSGKTTYLKQIVLLLIMAQIGCRVPATSAEFRISDRIFCRITSRDSLECNASTFAMEMKEMQHILKSITPRSVIILDEPCNSTAVDEGTALAWSICSKIAMSPAFTFVSTHFLYLTQMSNIYFNIRNFHLECIVTQDFSGRLEFKYNLKQGVTPISKYGIAVLKMSAFPKPIIDSAERLADQLSKAMQISLPKDPQPKTVDYICYQYYAKFAELEENGSLDYASARVLIEELGRDPRLNDLVPLEKPTRLRKTQSVEPDKEVSNSGHCLTEVSKPMKLRDLQSIETNSLVPKTVTQDQVIKMPLSESVKSNVLKPKVSQVESTTEPPKSSTTTSTSEKSATAEQRCSASEVQPSDQLKDGTPVKKRKVENDENFNESLNSIIDFKYKNLSISDDTNPVSTSSRSRGLNQSSKTCKSGTSLQNAYLSHSLTSKESLRERLKVFKKSIAKKPNHTTSSNTSPSLKSPQLPNFNQRYDQTSILKSFTRPVSNLSKQSLNSEILNDAQFSSNINFTSTPKCPKKSNLEQNPGLTNENKSDLNRTSSKVSYPSTLKSIQTSNLTDLNKSDSNRLISTMNDASTSKCFTESSHKSKLKHSYSQFSATMNFPKSESNLSKSSNTMQRPISKSNSLATTVSVHDSFDFSQCSKQNSNLLFPTELFQNNSLFDNSERSLSQNEEGIKSLFNIGDSASKSYLSLKTNYAIQSFNTPSMMSNFIPADLSKTKSQNSQRKNLVSPLISTSNSQKRRNFNQLQSSNRFSLNNERAATQVASAPKSTDLFKSPLMKKKKVERITKTDSDIRIMTSSAIKEAEIFRQIEGNKFDENMFYEKVQTQNVVDEDEISFCTCSYTSSQNSYTN